jgi:hypothetical protein
MKPVDKTSEDLFQKLRSRFSPVSMGDENADETATPADARIFNFMYKENGEEIGYISISIIDNRSFKVYYGTDLVDRIQNKTDWYNLLKELRMFAKRNLMSFDARDLAKNQLEPRDFKFISSQDKTYKEHEVTVSESVMFGSRRKSYQTMENVKMIVNHRKSIDETIPGARSRYIESIYLERADGERYKFPYNYLTGARAMARHVNEGGNPYDDMGKHIVNMIKEMRDLSKFARRTKKHAMEDENAGGIRNSVVERFHSMKKQLGAMSVKEGYARFVENFSAEEALVEDDAINQIKERFTQQVFDTQLEDTLPAVMKAIKEAQMKQVAEANTTIPSLIKSSPLVLRKDDAADNMFRTTKFTDGAGLLGFILSDIASRAIGDNADEIANFASDAAERVQDKDYDQGDKQTAMMLAKKYMDDVKKMTSDPSYKDEVRMDPKNIYGKMKKREGGFHESEAYEAWANDLVPENSVKKKFEATTQGTVGTQGTQAPANVGQALRDPNLQKAAKNVSRVTQAAGIKAPPNQIAQGMAAQATGKMPPKQTMQTIGGLGNTIMQAAASDPRKAAQLTAMMKKMVTQGKFDEDAVRKVLEAPASTVINDPKTNTSTVFKIPGSTPAQPKGMQQWLYGTGQNQTPSTPAAPSQVKPATPTAQFDKTQSAMPDMDAMVGQEKAKVTPTAPLIGKDPAVAKALAAKGFDPTGKKITAIPAQAGAARANIPTGSMPAAKMPSIPTNTGAAKANIPVGSMPASTGYTVKAGDNLTNILKGKGMAPTPDNIAKIAKLSGIANPNMIKPGQTIKFN